MASFENNPASGGTNGISPSITLYTNHDCPWAQRAHIILKELGLPYEEVIIDLDTPREPWYLEINPRGLVPTIKYSNGILENEIITESGVVAQFLADSRPSHLLPGPLEDPYAALFRARISFFVDAWLSKVLPKLMAAFRAEGEDAEKLSQEIVQGIEKEIEPLLKDANPFFSGKSEFTMAEVLVAPFILRLYAWSKDGTLLPTSLHEGVRKLPNFSKWADAIHKRESATYTWDEPRITERSHKRLAKMRAQAK